MPKIWENNGTEKIGLVTPTPVQYLARIVLTIHPLLYLVVVWLDKKDKTIT